MKSRRFPLLTQIISLIFHPVLPNLRLRLLQRPKSNGAPTLIYVAAAALRVADVTRMFKDKRLRSDKSGEVAKLFAKHFKLLQHVDYLKRTKVAAAVGTPGRLGKLLNEIGTNHLPSLPRLPNCVFLYDPDVLNVSAVSHIILDITHKDAKEEEFA
jgi:protein CMS1